MQICNPTVTELQVSSSRNRNISPLFGASHTALKEVLYMSVAAAEAWRQLQLPPTYKTAVKHCLAALQVDAQHCVHRCALRCSSANDYGEHQLVKQAHLSILPAALGKRASCSSGQAVLGLQQLMQSLTAYSKSTRRDALGDLQVRVMLCWKDSWIAPLGSSTVNFPAYCRFVFKKALWNSHF